MLDVLQVLIDPRLGDARIEVLPRKPFTCASPVMPTRIRWRSK